MNQSARVPGPEIVALGFAVVAAVFLSSGLFRRDLYAVSPMLYWAFDVLKFVVVPLAIAVLLAKRYDVWPKHYGLRGIAEHETWGSFLGLAVLLVVLLDVAYYVSWYIGWLIFKPEPEVLFYQEVTPKGLLRVPVAIYMAVTAGVVEEVFFRGLPLLYLERRFPNAVPKTSYILGTAFLFGLIHWPNGPHEIVATLVFGVLAAALYLRLGDLWPLIVAHAVTDLYGLAQPIAL